LKIAVFNLKIKHFCPKLFQWNN